MKEKSSVGKYFLLLSVCIILCMSCGKKEPPTVKVEEVSVSPTSLSLTEGDNARLTVTVLPQNAYNKRVIWSSTSEDVASVSDGIVMAVSPGTATIRVKSEDGGKMATCLVNVSAKYVPVTSITLNKTSASLKAGETVTLTATVKPDDATDKTVTWSTSDATVATVSNGVVTAKKVGSATITAKAGDKTATCAVTVVATQVTSITLDRTSASLKAGETVTLTATVKPDDATDKTVTWSSSDATVATVSNGVVSAKKVGSATITAKAGDKTATCTVTVVTTPVTSITLNRTSASLKAGETVTLTATVKPDDATDKTVTWSSSNASVATVNNGVVTAKKVGTATITAKAGDNSATCAITVEPTPVTGITLDNASVTLKEGQEIQLTATVEPVDATDKTVTWSSNKSEVATVDNTGKVKAIKEGSAIITAKAGDKTATCVISVSKNVIAVTSVTLDKTTASLKAGETVTLTATVKPDDATDKTVTWTTSNNSVAVVSNGLVTAKALGTAVITAAASGRTATCSITVIPTPVTSITINKTTVSLLIGEQEQLSVTVLPIDATIKTVVWSSLNEIVAIVDNNGLVTAKGKGETTIVAKSVDGSQYAECKIVVKDIQSGGIEDTIDEIINI